jgi:hypothetical protein
MSVPAVITALAPTLKGLFDAVNDYLKTVRNPNPNEVKKKVDSLQELSNNLVKLIELSSKSSQGLNHYVTFMRHSIKAGAYCTELARVLENLPNTQAKNRLDNFIDNLMVANLRGEGIQEIDEYPKDYVEALDHYEKAEIFANRAKKEIESNRKNSCINLDNANRELDRLAMLASNKVKKLVEDLQNAYKVLEKPAK